MLITMNGDHILLGKLFGAYVLFVLLIFTVLMVRRLRSYFARFRRLLSQYPDKCYEWLTQSDVWIVLPSGDPDTVGRELGGMRMLGPFVFAVPQLGNRAVTAYGKLPDSGPAMELFVDHMEATGGAIDLRLIPTRPQNRSGDISFTCKTCRQYVTVSRLDSGRLVTCPSCKKKVMAPEKTTARDDGSAIRGR